MAAISQPNPMSNALLSMAAPDYQVQQLQAQRQYALAQALREQAMQDTPGNGGSVSWTQGLARILDAYASTRANKRGDQGMVSANQALARGLMGMFGGGVQPGGPASVAPTPDAAATPPNAPPFTPGQAPAPGQPDPLAPLPDAPPQAASTPPSAAPSAPTGGAPSQPFIPPLPGLSPQQSMMAYFSDPGGYWDKVAAAHSPTDFAKLVQQAGIDPSSPLGRQVMQGQVFKQNYVPMETGRPGGWSHDPQTGRWIFHPQAPAPGSMPIVGPDGQATGVWTEDPSASNIQAHQAGAIAGAQAGAKAPFDVVPSFQNGQPGFQSKANITGGILNGRFYGGGQGLPSGPALGQSEAFGTYGKNSAQQFANTQEIAQTSPQRVQALREMEQLISGPNGLNTGPTIAKMQQLAEEHGLPFGYTSNGFVFNKDAARFIAQNASDLGLNGSDARLGMMANASPNMKMTPQALKVVIPTMIGLEYAKMAKATAATNFAQHNPAGNAQFESAWRQAYDPRMFTAYAQGGPAALAKAPANLRQQWLKDYRTLKGMGVDFTQFAQ